MGIKRSRIRVKVHSLAIYNVFSIAGRGPVIMVALF